MTYITTPIYYLNAAPHIGHLYTTILADIHTRQVGGYLLTGTDEHGRKIAEAAQGKNIKAFVDAGHAQFRKLFEAFEIKADRYIRTTDKDHQETVREVLTELYEKGLIYQGKYEGYYCPGCETYYPKDGYCQDHERTYEIHREDTYLFDLEPYREKIIDKIHQDSVWLESPWREEVLGYLRDPLPALCVARQDTKWGIALPWDEKYTAYVWVDALVNYLTGSPGEGDFRTRWNQDPAEHYLGKDILRHHSVIWPSLLLALGLGLPKRLHVHGHIVDQNRRKLSKSLGNVIDPFDLLDNVDGVRFALASLSKNQDAPFGKAYLEDKTREIRNTWGNLIQRVLVPIYKSGQLELEVKQLELGQISPDDLLALAREINQEIEDKKPWQNGNWQEFAEKTLALRSAFEAYLPVSSKLIAFDGQKITQKPAPIL